MTNEEAKMFLDNLKICINEHPIVADWLAEIADRKTENSSEKPNNCEPKICDTCRYYNSNIPCGSTPSACKEADKFAEEFVDGLKKLKQTEPTISKMEQVDKDTNVRSKDELMTEGVWNAGYKTGYDKGYKDAQKVKDSQDLVKDLVKAFCEDGTWLERQGVYTLTLAEAKQRAVDIIESVLAKDEPTTQMKTQNSNLTFEKDECAKEYEELGLKELKELIKADRKDEPQTEEHCETCRHKDKCEGATYEYKNTEWWCLGYAPIDEPQTDCPWK